MIWEHLGLLQCQLLHIFHLSSSILFSGNFFPQILPKILIIHNPLMSQFLQVDDFLIHLTRFTSSYSFSSLFLLTDYHIKFWGSLLAHFRRFLWFYDVKDIIFWDWEMILIFPLKFFMLHVSLTFITLQSDACKWNLSLEFDLTLLSEIELCFRDGLNERA